MNNKLVLLHLSDLHYDSKKVDKYKDIVGKIINDVNNFLTSNSLSLSSIVFTGDLVNSGTEENYRNSRTDFIDPLVDGLKCEYKDFIYVPGNHEVDLSSISKQMELALDESFQSLDNLDKYTDDDYKMYFANRLSRYFSFMNSLDNSFSSDPWFVRSRRHNQSDKSIGFMYINTAWKSRGDSIFDKNNICYPIARIDSEFSKISNCYLKICIMHHPSRWVREDQIDAFENMLSAFDIVLSGHIHRDLSINNIGPNNRTFISTANKLMPIDDDNGYYIYVVDLNDVSCRIISRKYYTSRGEYDKKIDKATEGEWTVQLKNVDPISATTYRIKNGIHKRFVDSCGNLFLTNKLSDDSEHSTTPFVRPTFSVTSFPVGSKKSLEKGKQPTEVKWDDLFENNKIVKIFGEKESGKTVLCHYIARHILDNYIDIKKIPIIIDYDSISAIKHDNSVFWQAKMFVEKYADDSLRLSTDDIKTMLRNNRVVLIIDNFRDEDNDNDIIDKFLCDYHLSSIILVVNKSIIVTGGLVRERYKYNYDKFYYVDMNSFSKNQIRELSKSIIRQTEIDYDALCDRVVSCFNIACLPRTPFALTLFLSVCQFDANFEPLNISTMIERYVELLLQKLSKEDIKSKSYDYKSKSSFLASFAKVMYDHNRYYLTRSEFDDFLGRYHNLHSFIVSDTRFDAIFFEQGILVSEQDKIYFRFKCLNMYFLAVYAISTHDFATIVANSSHYYNYSDFFNYYSGLKRNDEKLLMTMVEKITPAMQYDEGDQNNLLSVDSIKANVIVGKDYKQNILESEPLPEEIRDKDTDISSNPDYDPETLDYERELSEEEIMVCTIEILGSIIKNSEDTAGENRSKAIDYYINGTNKILELLVSICHDVFRKMIGDFDDEKDKEIDNRRKAINKSTEEIKDMIRIAMPIAVHMWVRENIGTGKLRTIILEKLEARTNDKMALYSYVMLYCDLRLPGWEKVLKKYIRSCSSEDLLKVTYYKCRYYLFYNYYPYELNELKQVLVDITEKVMNISTVKARTEVEELVSKVKTIPER